MARRRATRRPALRIAPARDGGMEPGDFAQDRRGWPVPPRFGSGPLDRIARRMARLIAAGQERRFNKLLLAVLARRPLNDLPVHGALPRGPIPSAHRRRWAGLMRYGYALRWEARRRTESEAFDIVIRPVLEPGYLGDPKVVFGLVEPFLLTAVQVAKAEVPAGRLDEERDRLADIFAGFDPAHLPVGTQHWNQHYRDLLVSAMGLEPADLDGANTRDVVAAALRALETIVATRVRRWRSEGGTLDLADVHELAGEALLGRAPRLGTLRDLR
jgi:hypothetical protein